jgi:hypothetical protein
MKQAPTRGDDGRSTCQYNVGAIIGRMGENGIWIVGDLAGAADGGRKQTIQRAETTWLPPCAGLVESDRGWGLFLR